MACTQIVLTTGHGSIESFSTSTSIEFSILLDRIPHPHFFLRLLQFRFTSGVILTKSLENVARNQDVMLRTALVAARAFLNIDNSLHALKDLRCCLRGTITKPRGYFAGGVQLRRLWRVRIQRRVLPFHHLSVPKFLRRPITRRCDFRTLAATLSKAQLVHLADRLHHVSAAQVTLPLLHRPPPSPSP